MMRKSLIQGTKADVARMKKREQAKQITRSDNCTPRRIVTFNHPCIQEVF